MIYCNLKGGLGNMMFQIATAKSFSLKKNVSCSFPNFLEHLEYANNRWAIQANTEKNLTVNNSYEYRKFINIDFHKIDKPVNVYSYPFHYIDFIPKENNFLIDGYFQSEKYFQNHKKEILDMFESGEEIDSYIKNKYSYILNENSVGIHVRRGDYLRYPEYHPVQTPEYYYQGLEIIKDYDSIVVFSDDISWCKEVFKFKNIHFIKNEKDYIEMFLMSKCKHNIICNSSFSWWAAWLNKNQNKIVVGPSKWFGNMNSHLNTQDILPNEWRKI